MQTYLWVPPDSPPLCPRASVSPLVTPEHSVEARSRRPSLHSSPAATNPSTQAQKPAADDAAQPPQPHGALPDVPWSLGCLPGAQATAAFGGQTAVAAAARKVAGPPSWTYRAPKAAQASLRTSVSVTAAGTGDEGDAGAGEAGSAAAPLPLPRRSMGHRPAGVALSASTLLSYSSSQTRGHSARVRDALAGSVTSYRSSLRYSRQCGSGREQRSSVGPRAGGPPLSSVGCVRLRAYTRWAKGSGLAGTQAGPAAAHQAPFPARAQRGCAAGTGPSSPPGCAA